MVPPLSMSYEKLALIRSMSLAIPYEPTASVGTFPSKLVETGLPPYNQADAKALNEVFISMTLVPPK